MVIGIDKFSEYFRGHEGSYVLIGGAASNLIEESNLLVPRATKDLDLILVVEALTDAFVKRFWQFVREAGYVHRQRGTEKAEFYHFVRSLDALKASLTGGNKTIILDKDSELARILYGNFED